MPWVRVDDAFYDHPKWIEAGPLAGWLGMCGLAWCNRNQTDGFIPHGKVQLLADFSMVGEVDQNEDPTEIHIEGWRVSPYILADRLIELGLWERAVGGFHVHNYLKYQKSADEIRDIAAKRAASGRKGGQSTREASDEADDKQTGSKPEANVEAQSQSQPRSSNEELGAPESPKKNQQKPPADFEPSAAHHAYALKRGLDLDDERERWLTWCEANGRTYSGVNAGFSTWLSQAVDFGRGGQPAPATLEDLATPAPKPEPWTCTAGDKLCRGGYVDEHDDHGNTRARPCRCRTMAVPA